MCDMHAMSIAGMRMPGQTWTGSAVSFLTTWVVMMAVMMLPVLIPMLRHYRAAVVESSRRRLCLLTAIVAAGYFALWAAAGVGALSIVEALSAIVARRPTLAGASPLVVCAIVIAAGAWQFTSAKDRQLAWCRERPDGLSADSRTAWRHGLRLGAGCVRCCANLTAILMAVGVMNSAAMSLVTAAIVAERVTPAGERAARATGVVAVIAGLALMAGWSIRRSAI